MAAEGRSFGLFAFGLSKVSVKGKKTFGLFLFFFELLDFCLLLGWWVV